MSDDTISLAGAPPVPTPLPTLVMDMPPVPPAADERPAAPDPDESRTEAMRQRAAELRLVQAELDGLSAVVASLARVSEPGFRKHVAETLIRQAERMYAEQIMVVLGIIPEGERRY